MAAVEAVEHADGDHDITVERSFGQRPPIEDGHVMRSVMVRSRSSCGQVAIMIRAIGQNATIAVPVTRVVVADECAGWLEDG